MEGECYNNDVPYINKMKLKELTKEQRANIEADELGKFVIEIDEGFVNMNYVEYAIRKNTIHAEIKRTIKRIEDEIETLTDIINLCEFDRTVISLKYMWRNLHKKKQLYELMEQLE